MADPNQMFAAAGQALSGGNAVEALRLLDLVARQVDSHPAVTHMRAAALKRLGRLEEALAAFEQARRLAPRDAEIANNYANLMSDIGRTDAALALYDEALANRPDYRDAAFNKALLLQRLGRYQEALQLLDPLCGTGSQDARAHSGRGAALRGLFRHREAAEAFDRALALQPRLATAVKGRAQVALERGETAAAGLFRHARTVDPRDPSVVYGLAEALEAEGDPSALDLLRAALSERPDWVQGHELLARMRAEAGDEDFASDFAAAAERQPGDRAMQVALARTYASAELWNEALAVADRIAQDPEVAMLRAYLLGEAGEPERALALMESSAVQPDAAAHAAMGRMALQAGDLSRATQELERAVALDANLVAAWSQLELVWRAAGDDRSHWLSGQPGLWSTQDIGLSADELEETAALLRLLHRTRAHPIGQSLRGGTQTRGRLFLREEPAIGRLHDALLAAVRRHAAQLPPADPRHPLLRHRGADLRIAGSWSVRLLSQGFHVHHIHPAGVLSSACYLALPDTLGDQADRSGWLELGRPPAGLHLSLEPLTAIEPAPGRLALFPSYLYHGTRPFRDGERLTVAFDVVAG